MLELPMRWRSLAGKQIAPILDFLLRQTNLERQRKGNPEGSGSNFLFYREPVRDL
jgi:hypothetical protein